MDETRLCPSTLTHEAPLNEASGIQGQDHPRNLLDGDMDINHSRRAGWDCPEHFLHGLFTLQNFYTAQFLRLFRASLNLFHIN